MCFWHSNQTLMLTKGALKVSTKGARVQRPVPYTVFCFNTSSQSEMMQNGNEAVAIIEKDGNDNMEVFAVCLEDSHVNYNITNGVLSEL